MEILAADFSHFYAAKNLIKPPLPTQLHNHSLQKQRKKSECACLIERESVWERGRVCKRERWLEWEHVKEKKRRRHRLRLCVWEWERERERGRKRTSNINLFFCFFYFPTTKSLFLENPLATLPNGFRMLSQPLMKSLGLIIRLNLIVFAALAANSRKKRQYWTKPARKRHRQQL